SSARPPTGMGGGSLAGPRLGDRPSASLSDELTLVQARPGGPPEGMVRPGGLSTSPDRVVSSGTQAGSTVDGSGSSRTAHPHRRPRLPFPILGSVGLVESYVVASAPAPASAAGRPGR